MAAMPSRAIRSWSAALVYLATSVSVVWPLMEAMTFALHPASARRRQAALRRPMGGAVLGQAGLVETVAIPIAETGSSERLTVCCGEQGQII